MDLLCHVVSKKLEYTDEVLNILALLLHNCQQLPDYVFPYLMLRKLLEGVLHQTQLQCENI